MNRNRLLFISVLTILLVTPVQPVTSDWVDLEMTSPSTLVFPAGGGTCTTGLRVPVNGSILNTRFSLCGRPLEMNHSYEISASEMWQDIADSSGLNYTDEGISFGQFGSWWEQNAATTLGSAINQVQSSNWTQNENGTVRLTGAVNGPPQKDKDTLGLWHLDEMSGMVAQDSSDGGNAGTLSTGTMRTDTRFGRGLLFDGIDDRLDMIDPSAFNFDGSSPFSMEAWIKTPGSPLVQTLFEKKQASPERGYELSIQSSSNAGGYPGSEGKLIFRLIGTYSTNLLSAIGNTRVDDGIWHHVAVTYDGSRTASGVHLFIDGKRETESNPHDTLSQTVSNTGNLVIGYRYISGPSAFNGTIDEIRISGICKEFKNFDNARLLSPVVNVTFNSRAMMLGPIPSSTDCSVNVLDPGNGSIIQSSVKNGDSLDISIWTDRNVSSVPVRLELVASSRDVNVTPVIRKWGIGTGIRFNGKDDGEFGWSTRTIEPFNGMYGNVIVNASTRPNTGYWVNASSESGDILLSGLHNGDPICINSTLHTRIRLELKLFSNSSNETTVIHDWGAGMQVFPLLDDGRIGVSENLDIGNNRLSLKRAELLDWIKEDGIRVDIGGSGSNQDVAVYGPSIVRLPDKTFRMYYNGVTDSYMQYMRIFSAVSPDGVNWTKEAGIRVNNGGSYDNRAAFNPSVLKMQSGISRMYYSGYAGGVSTVIMSATSNDGLTWTKESGLRVNYGGTYDALVASAPSVIPLGNNTYRMYYEGKDGSSRYRILSAYSSDGFNFVKDSGIRIDGVSSYSVVSPSATQLANGTFYMTYTTANASGIAGIFSALSTDGLNWTRNDRPLIIPGGTNDVTYVGNPEIYSPDGVDYRLYYAGTNGSITRILSARPSAFFTNGSVLSNVTSFPVNPNSLELHRTELRPASTATSSSIRTSQDGQAWSRWMMYDDSTFVNNQTADIRGPYCQFCFTLKTSVPTVTPVLIDPYISYGELFSSANISANHGIIPSGGQVTSARPVIEGRLPAGTNLEILLSVDDGITWAGFTNETWSDFNVPGAILRWKLILSGDHCSSPRVKGLRIDYRTVSYPSGVQLDIGDDGITDWASTGMVSAKIDLPDLNSTLSKYVREHGEQWDTDGFVTVPCRFSSTTGGALVLEESSIDLAAAPELVNALPTGLENDITVPIELQFNKRMDGASIVVEINPSLPLWPNWSADGKVLRFSHPEMKDDTNYTVMLRAGARSAEGLVIPGDHSWTFGTTLFPRILSMDVSDATVALETTISFCFNKPMKKDSISRSIRAEPHALLADPVWITDETVRFDAFFSQASTKYLISISSSARDTLDNPLFNPRTFNVSTGPGPDLNGTPRIIHNWPTGNLVPLEPMIVVTFDQPMNLTSVTDSFFIEPHDGANIVSTHSTQTSFTLSATLQHETEYTIAIGSGAKSLATGNGMGAPFVWNFTTIPAQSAQRRLPTVFFTEPADGALMNASSRELTIFFSEEMEPVNTVSASSVSPFLPGSWSWLHGSGRILQFISPVSFSPGNYSLVITDAAKNVAGNKLDGNSDSIAQSGNDSYVGRFSVGHSVQKAIPRLVSWSPNGTVTDLRATVRLEFDRPMNESSLRKAFSSTPRMDGTWAANREGTVFTFTPFEKHSPETTYLLVIRSTAVDTLGNPLGCDNVWTFTTVASGNSISTQKTDLTGISVALTLLMVLVLLVTFKVRSRRSKELPCEVKSHPEEVYQNPGTGPDNDPPGQ